MSSAAITVAQKYFLPRSPGEIFLALLALALLPFFFVSGPHWLATDWGRALANLAHIPFFALLVGIAALRIPRSRPGDWLRISVGVLVLSVVIEALQAQVGRSASAHDVLRNLTGTWLAIFWLQRPNRTVWLGRIAASVLLTVEMMIVAVAVVGHYQLVRQLPLVANLEAPAEVRRWKAINSELLQTGEVTIEGDFALKAVLLPGDFSGLALQRLPHDWSPYTRLHFDLYNAQDSTMHLTLRVHDARHETGDYRWEYGDRFNTKLALEPGWNRYSIALSQIAEGPQNRKLDLTLIRELRLFTAGLETPKVVYADNFRLER